MINLNFPKIYLASSSQTRQELLRDACIEFEVITQDSDEKSINWDMPLEFLVCKLAELKMAHVQIPDNNWYRNKWIEDAVIYVLTADTLTEDINKKILGKPKNRDEAIEQIKLARSGSKVATGFCLEKKIYKSGAWLTEQKITKAVTADCKLIIQDQYIDYYLDNTHALYGCGSIIIDGAGSLFLKEINGSYSTILGLPLFEILEALQKI